MLPANGLAALSPVRVRDGIFVTSIGSKVWVTWPLGVEQVWQRLLSVPAAEFFELRNGRWYELGHSLPRFDLPPQGEARRLDATLFPSPLQPEPLRDIFIKRVSLRLVSSDRIRPTAAIRVSIVDLLSWAERAITADLSGCRAARFGDRVILRGAKLPAIAGAERFWGGRVWLPLGYHAEPDLPETALRAAADAPLDEILLITEAGPEMIPENAFQPLTRAAARMLALKS